MIDLAKLLELAEGYSQKSAMLSSESLTLVFCLFQYTELFRWRGDADELTSAEMDTIQAISDKMFKEISAVNMLMGSVQFFAGTPSSEAWLLCDGSMHDRVDYPELYAMLSPDLVEDSDTFRVPDLVNRFVRGSDEYAGVQGGSDTHTLTNEQMPSHRHLDAGHTHTYLAAMPAVSALGAGVPFPIATSLAGVTGIGVANLSYEGGDEPHPNVPAHTYLFPYILAR